MFRATQLNIVRKDAQESVLVIGLALGERLVLVPVMQGSHEDVRRVTDQWLLATHFCWKTSEVVNNSGETETVYHDLVDNPTPIESAARKFCLTREDKDLAILEALLCSRKLGPEAW